MLCAKRRTCFADPETDERFLFQLARDLGCTVKQLDDPDVLDIDEFVKWKALYMVERAERKHAAEKARRGIK